MILLITMYSVAPSALAEGQTNTEKITKTELSATPVAIAEAIKNSEAAEKTADNTAKSTKAPRITKTFRHWSTRKKILVAVVVGCLIATAITVPICVHAHRVQDRRHDASKKVLSQVLLEQKINQRIAKDIEQQTVIQNLLGSSSVSPAQKALLQSQFNDLQSEIVFFRSPELNFLLVGDPNRPNGGFLSRFPDLYLPILKK